MSLMQLAGTITHVWADSSLDRAKFGAAMLAIDCVTEDLDHYHCSPVNNCNTIGMKCTDAMAWLSTPHMPCSCVC